MILVIDNHDSFTFNLVAMLRQRSREVVVLRRDDPEVAVTLDSGPEALVVSPGPGRPEDAPALVEQVRGVLGRIPILGVCLGHQVLGLLAGASVVHAGEPVHGKVHGIAHDGRCEYAGIRTPFRATRYHSLVLLRDGLGPDVKVTSQLEDGTVMGIRWGHGVTVGVQFHPESIGSEAGGLLVDNFLAAVRCGSWAVGPTE